MSRRISSETLFERESECAALLAAVERARAGTPSVTVVMGEAGIGKTRLVSGVGERAEAAGVLVLTGDCLELDGGELPYAPIAACLRDLPATSASEARAALSQRARVELAHALPGLGWDDEPGDDASGGLDRFSQARLFEFLLALVRALSRGPPVLLIVEDIQWADRSTQDFIRFLVHNVRVERLAVVVTYRDGELRQDHPVRRMLAELIRSDRVDCLQLEPLSADGVAAQVDAILGERAPAELSAETFARSGGNPFLVEELLASRAAGRGAADLPSTLRDALLMRFEQMGPETQSVLRAAAAIGRPASTPLLAGVTGGDDREVSAALRDAVRHHVLVRSSPDAFGFRHGLVREVVYDDLLPAERLELHARVAESLPADAWGEMAFHWRAAGRPVEALASSARAALRAEHARAFGEALEHFQRALELMRETDPPPRQLPLDPESMRERAARLARYCGDYGRAIELSNEALATLDPVAEPVRAAEIYELRGRCQSWDEDCGLASFRQALELLPEQNGAERARLLGAEGFALVGLRCWAEARERCEAAVALAERVGATRAEAYARARLGLALAFLGDLEAAEEQVLWARDTAERLGLAEDLLYSQLYLGEVRRLRGRLNAAYGAMAEGQRTAQKLGMEASFGRFMTLNGAADLFMLGRWDEALSRLEETAGVHLEPWEALVRHQVAGQLAVARGDSEAALGQLAQGRALCESGAPADYVPGIFAALAEEALWRGQPGESLVLVDGALHAVADREDLLNTPVLYSVGTRACADAAEHGRAVGAERDAASARARAETLVDQLAALLARHGGSHPSPSAIAHRALCTAEVARARGEPAVDAWRRAAAAWRSLEIPYIAAYAEWRQAEGLLAEGGGREEAARVAGHSLGEAVRLGAIRLRHELEGLAQRARLKLHETGAPALAATDEREGARERPLGLTGRELEVLELIAEGFTNRQIAERLFISEKTAGVHVSHILAKLNVHNRVTAAGLAHRLGLLPSRSPR